METIYDRIERRLQEIGMNKRQLSDETGMPYSTLIAAFNRHSDSFSFKYLPKIAEALDTTVDSLLYGETTTHTVSVVDLETGTSELATMPVFPKGHPLHVPKYEAEIANAEVKATFETKIETALEAITQDYQLLNPIGRGEAAKRIHELTLIDEYTKES